MPLSIPPVWIQILRLLIPGVAFSSFVIFYLFNRYNKLTLGVMFSILVFAYSLSVMLGFQSWGFAVPIIGGIGACLIQKISRLEEKIMYPNFKKFFWLGFASSLTGFLISLTSEYTHAIRLSEGDGMGVIVVVWQLIVGFAFIELIESDSIIKKHESERME